MYAAPMKASGFMQYRRELITLLLDSLFFFGTDFYIAMSTFLFYCMRLLSSRMIMQLLWCRIFFLQCTNRAGQDCCKVLSCVWTMLALLGNSRTMVVVLTPLGLWVGCYVLHQLDQLVGNNCECIVHYCSSTLVSVVQWGPVLQRYL